MRSGAGTDLLAALQSMDLEPVQSSLGPLSTDIKFLASVETTPEAIPAHLDASTQGLWRLVSEACLFCDTTYGQWGLRILPFERAIARTEGVRRKRSLSELEQITIVGEFLGDSDLLGIVVSSDPAVDGQVVVVGAIDGPRDWARPAASLGEFLQEFRRTQGSKFWEQSQDQ